MERTVRIYTDVIVDNVEEGEGYQDILDKSLEVLKNTSDVTWKGEVLFTKEEYEQLLEEIKADEEEEASA